MRKYVSALVLLMAVASAAGANELNIEGKPFAEQVSSIRSEMRAGGRYGEMSPEDQSTVNTLLGRMSMRIQEAGGVDKLTPNIRVDLFNDQETVNVLLTRAAADSRVVCRREKATGTNRATKSCMTVAERRRYTEAAQEFMRRSGAADRRN